MVQIGDALRRQCGRVSLIILLMIYHNRIRDRTRLLCQALVQPSQAPWRKLFEHGDEHTFLHMTGLTREAFRALLDYLFDRNYLSRYRRRGRPPSLPPEGFLGLLLFYLGSTMSIKHLCFIFGVTPTVCSRIIDTMLKRVVRLLRDHPLA